MICLLYMTCIAAAFYIWSVSLPFMTCLIWLAWSIGIGKQRSTVMMHTVNDWCHRVWFLNLLYGFYAFGLYDFVNLHAVKYTLVLWPATFDSYEQIRLEIQISHPLAIMSEYMHLAAFCDMSYTTCIAVIAVVYDLYRCLLWHVLYNLNHYLLWHI